MPYDIFLKNALLWIKKWHNSGVPGGKKGMAIPCHNFHAKNP